MVCSRTPNSSFYFPKASCNCWKRFSVYTFPRFLFNLRALQLWFLSLDSERLYRISHSNSACFLLEILVKSHPYSAWENRDHTTTQPGNVKITVKPSQDEFRCVDNTRYLFPVEAILKHRRKKQSHFHNRNTVQRNDDFFERSFLHFVKRIVKNSSRQLLENIERIKAVHSSCEFTGIERHAEQR